MKVSTRMAPSPTGEYHIGHIRTLLFNFAWARKNKGRFIIRIEDTDRERFIEGATEKILEVITDYGFGWDEGPRVGGRSQPYFQSLRLPIYKKYALELVNRGHAYYCFCSKERLEKLREKQQETGEAARYDRLCKGLSKAEVESRISSHLPCVIRLRVPDNQVISFTDVVMGEIKFNSSALDDQVLLKSDGYPTYHLAVVIDDYLMEITHVIRGNEWISSTPKHILLYRAFGWERELPVYVHLPVFLDPEGVGKMSKRKRSISARSFLDQGYFPEAILNYLMLLGWNPGTQRELFTLDEFIAAFDLKDLNKSNPRFTYEKLNWFNQQYIRATQDISLIGRMTKFTSRSTQEVRKVLPLVKDRLVTLKDFDKLASYFFEAPKIDLSAIKSLKVDHKKVLQQAKKVLEENWSGMILEDKARQFCTENNIAVGDYFMVLRVAITGRTATPPLWDVMEILGKEKALKRLDLLL